MYACVFDPLPPDSSPPCSAVHQSVRPEDELLPVMGSSGLLTCWTSQLMFAPLRAFISDWPAPLYIHWCINLLFLSSCIYTVSLHIEGLCASFLPCFSAPKLISVSPSEDLHLDRVRQLFPNSCKTWYVFKVKLWRAGVKILTIWCIKLKEKSDIWGNRPFLFFSKHY